MGLSHSPSIVTSNLILCLDAANPKSYSGSGNTWFDITGRANHGTLVNGPSYSSNSGGFISCDGTNDYIEILDNSIFDFGTNNFTVEHWFRKNATSSNSNYWGVNKWNTGASPGTNEWVLSLGNSSSGIGESIQFGIESGSTSYEMMIPNTPTLHLWNQVVGIRAGAGLSVYMNGALIGTSSPVGITTTTSVNNISGRNIRIANSALNNYYNKVDSSIVRIYNKALTPDEVKQNYDANKARYLFSNPIFTDGLVLYYDASSLVSYQGSGTVVADLSGNKNTGVLTNGPTYTSVGSSSYFTLDGTNDFIASTVDTSLFTTNATMVIWLKNDETTPSTTTYTGFIGFGNGGENDHYPWVDGFAYLSTLRFGRIGPITLSPTVTRTNIHMVSVTSSSTEWKLYQNAVLQYKTSSQSSVQMSNTRIGYSIEQTYNYKGRVYSFMLYNRVLSPSELFHIYQSNRGRYGV
ncbi:hypothetical protein CCP3SC1AL1_1210002 [Gammaproteobacteria bacterium]